MKNTRYIPLKNYIILGLIGIGTILLVVYIFSWYHAYEDNLYKESYLLKNNVITKEITSLSELKTVLKETPNEYFILINYTGNKDTYKLEKKLKKVIKKYELNDEFYYLNVTDIIKDDNYLDQINNALDLDGVKIKNVPTIIYVSDNTITQDNIISREDKKIMDVSDFQKLLDINEINEP